MRFATSVCEPARESLSIVGQIVMKSEGREFLLKANLHMPCHAHAIPLPCHATLIHTYHAVLLPFSDSACVLREILCGSQEYPNC
jgi:hypothetical protein